MEKLMDFYRSVQNPLDDLDKLKTIIKVYSDSKKNNKRFYSLPKHSDRSGPASDGGAAAPPGEAHHEQKNGSENQFISFELIHC